MQGIHGQRLRQRASSVADCDPAAPIIFTKVPQSVDRARRAILVSDGVSEQLRLRAELAVIIGKGGRGIPLAKTMDHVWGYTIVTT